MKSRTLTRVTAVTLFAALAMPLRLAAQDKQDNHKHHHYQLIDMGTFGGPQSLVSEGTQVVNNRGLAIGDSDTSIPDPNYPNSCLFCSNPFIQHAFQWKSGVQTDLGALPGVNSSFATWISGNGLVAGYSENSLIDPLLSVPELHAVLWKKGQIIDLGTLEGGLRERGVRRQQPRPSSRSELESCARSVWPVRNTKPDVSMAKRSDGGFGHLGRFRRRALEFRRGRGD
jgi:hypothetical protein